MQIYDDPIVVSTWHYHHPILLVTLTGTVLLLGLIQLTSNSTRKVLRRYRGLLNEGNSCYINSVLFSLASIFHLKPCVYSGSSFFSTSLVGLLEELNQKTLKGPSLSVSKRLSIQHTGRQHDAHEFLSAFLQSIPRIPLHVWSLKEGIQTSQLLPWDCLTMQVVGCPLCIRKGLVAVRLETCSMHTIYGSNDSLIDALSLSTEVLDDHKRDSSHCKCLVEHGAMPSIKQTAIVRWPALLLIHCPQLCRNMSVPIDFEPNRSIPGICQPSMVCKYKLCAAVIHQSLHYFTVRRLPNTDRWLYCSDTTVFEIDNPDFYLDRAYILFYESISATI